MPKRILLSIAVLLVSVAASARNLYIPVAGRTQGANDTFFRTDVRLFNPSSTDDLHVTLHYLPQRMDGSNIPGRMVTVPRRQMVVLNDIVGTFFEWPAPTVGAIRIDSNEDRDYAIIATSRTYTDTQGSGGTYGQFIPALDESAARQKSIVLHVTHSADVTNGFRANVGMMNPGREAVVVTPSVVMPDGTLVAEAAAITIPPMSMAQLPFAELIGTRSVDHAFVHFDASAPVFTYASVVDNRTGDQFFVAGQEDRADVRPLP